ncbi:hypothetical protein [Fusibacter sp. JL216-2]|uniref:hypothetical protein n=1 Tax=Fusibacter sp. JL216-2 TaxID=3071453 RepID=UPI003D354B91
MDNNLKDRLAELKEVSKFEVAKKQLLEEFRTLYGVELGDKDQVSNDKSVKIHDLAYKKLDSSVVTSVKFRYTLKEEVQKWFDSVFSEFIELFDRKVILYPATFRSKVLRTNREFYNFPISFYRTFEECKEVLDVVIHHSYIDVLIVTEDLTKGILIYEDEYEYVFIQHW